MSNRSLRIPLAKALAALMVFGSAAPSVRTVELDAYALGIVRLGAAALVLGALLAAKGELSPRIVKQWAWPTWKALIGIGTVFGLHWLSYFLAIKWASASIGSIGFTTYGVQLPLLGWAFGFGRPAAKMWAAVAMGLAGALLCVPVWDFRSEGFAGLVLAILSGTSYAAMPLMHQRHAEISNGIRTWAQFMFALPLFLVLLPLASWEMSWKDFPWLIHLALVTTVVGHGLWVQATTELPVQITAVLAFLLLPIAVFMAWLIVGEQITPRMAAGAALVVAGNVVAMRHHRAVTRAETEI